MLVGFCFYQQSLCFQLFHDQRPRFPNVHARELSCNRQELPSKVDDLLLIEFLSFGNVKINRVMPRGNGHGSGSKPHIYGLIFNYSRFNLAIDPFKLYLLAFCVVFVAFVFGMHHHVFIPKLCFGPCCCNSKGSVLQVVESIFLFPVLRF